ncbi:MAG: hypothetical protein M1325_03365, partial [Actinobacteria bacterium]|nr:hypothetical protein [Actinomycetota bacterium]
MLPKKIGSWSIVIVAAVLPLLASCGTFGGGPAETTVSPASQNALPLTNQNWPKAAADPGRYVGSRVELTGTIFNVIGSQPDGAFHFQMFTDPASRSGNTHVAWGGGGEGLKEGAEVSVTGTFKEIRVTTSLAGTELRVPYVVADAVEVVSPETPIPGTSPSPRSASPTPPPTLAPLVVTSTLTVTPTAIVTATPTIVPPATPSPTPTLTVTPRPITPTVVVTPTPSAAVSTPTPIVTPTAVVTPTVRPPTPTALPAPAQPASATVEQGKPTQVGLSGAAVTEPMSTGRDAGAIGGTYLQTSKTDQSWNGSGKQPVSTGGAAVVLDVAQEGEYA